ncbi:hypothetical protein BH24GEM3_BH24GEM3_17440 [soil metagenome]
MEKARQRQPIFTKTAAKGIAKLPPHVKAACENVVRELAAGTLQGKKLKGELAAFRSIRLGQGYRLIYREGEDTIEILDVGPRGNIYKR